MKIERPTDTKSTNKKPPRPVILITKSLQTYSIVTPKSMTLASDGYQESSDFSLAGHSWVVPESLEEVKFYIGSSTVTYKLPKE